MREWKLRQGDPLYLVLSADASLDKTSIVDDQIWSVEIGTGDPTALGLLTTFGLRAKNFRIFPRFSELQETRLDPSTFTVQPIIKHLETNFICMEFSPFPDINVSFEIWVPDSNSCSGKIYIHNNGETRRSLRLDLVAQLSPHEGERMAPSEIQAATVLVGKTAGLYPLLFVAGGAEVGPGPFPSLSIPVVLSADQYSEHAWTHAATPDPIQSLDLARTVASQNWDAAVARLEIFHTGKLEIETGNDNWDAVLSASSRLAYRSLVDTSQEKYLKSFVLSRNPDQGHSIIGDGSHYDQLWAGPTPLDLYYLIDILLPYSIQTCKELLLNFLASQGEDGFIGLKAGFQGDRTHILATPILATIALKISSYDADPEFLSKIFPNLSRFLEFWFNKMNDIDRDGIPEWSNVIQTGIEDNPYYSAWNNEGVWLDIRFVESPTLASLLCMECKSLIQIAEMINLEEKINHLQSRIDILQEFINQVWNPEANRYSDRDRDSHSSQIMEILGQITGPGKLPIKQSYSYKTRPVFTIKTTMNGKRNPEVTILGRDSTGRFCKNNLGPDNFIWYFDRGICTSTHLFTAIEWIKFDNIQTDDQVRVTNAGFDQNSLAHSLPLWAGIIQEETITKLIEGSILNPDEFLTENGLSLYSRQDKTSAGDQQRMILPFWHLPILEGMINSGYRREATQILIRLVNTIIKNLQDQKCFRRRYDGFTGKGSGERNHLHGIIPVGLFLNTLGVRVISSRKIHLEGQNPFPWSVWVRYKGTAIYRQNQNTTVIFPNGKSVEINSTAPCFVTLEGEQIVVEDHSKG